jgi:hypothetical protein
MGTNLEVMAVLGRGSSLATLQATPEAIRVFNTSRAKKIGLFHVTC